MIRVDRSTVAPPPSLARRATSGSHAGQTEEEAITAAYAAYRAAQPPPQEKFSFPFKAYKNDDVKAALDELFHGKCAYCEQRYASTQPMDVEHWRPKGGVEDVDDQGIRKLLDGYPWLAARWTNLLPSCIDCNRPRIQRDVRTGESVTLGKANQFPVSGPRMMPPQPGGPPPVEDVALIIDPTVEDPAEHLAFRDDGAVLGRTDKGEQSIRVYALNRAELAFERLGLARLIEQRLTTIEALAAVIADESLPTDLQRDLEDLASHEIDALLELTDPGRPFSAMARQLIEENSPLQLTPHPAVPPWSTEVGARLQRFADQAPGPHHVRVATQLAGLGFAPHLAPSGTSYVRWTRAGTVRSVTLYQTAGGLDSDSARQHDEAAALPGARVMAGDRVRFGYATATVDQALAAATRLRDWSDGR